MKIHCGRGAGQQTTSLWSVWGNGRQFPRRNGTGLHLQVPAKCYRDNGQLFVWSCRPGKRFGPRSLWARRADAQAGGGTDRTAGQVAPHHKGPNTARKTWRNTNTWLLGMDGRFPHTCTSYVATCEGPWAGLRPTNFKLRGAIWSVRTSWSIRLGL